MTTNTPESRLQELLRELQLSGMRQCYAAEADLARKQSLTYERYLLETLERETETRRANRVGRFLRESKLPLEETLEAFDRKRLPRKVDQQVAVLLGGNFLNRRENVLAFGNPGSGKTHLLCAIAQELVQQGHRR